MQKAVERAAKLAKLSVNADEVTRYARDLEGILKHLDLIQELDLTDIPATTHALNLVCPTRADVPQRVLDSRDRTQRRPRT